jgi:ribonuclease HII
MGAVTSMSRIRLPPDGRHERRQRRHGYRRIAGVDEAGRGPLAGPVVAAAVILPRLGDCPPSARRALRLALPELHDSKLIAELHRERLFDAITLACASSVGLAEVEEIDAMGIGRASLLAMRRAVDALQCPPDFVFTDAFPIPELPFPQEAIVHGDALCRSIAAASIVAKVTRDRLMCILDMRYPGYGLAQHKGYGTGHHLASLRRLGPSPIHRRSFAPVRTLIDVAETVESDVGT